MGAYETNCKAWKSLEKLRGWSTSGEIARESNSRHDSTRSVLSKLAAYDMIDRRKRNGTEYEYRLKQRAHA